MAADVAAADPLPGAERDVTPSTDGPTRTWFYLTLLFSVVTVVYGLSVLALDSAYFLFPDELGLLLWIGVFVASGPLTLFLWLDTRAVARANRNPEFVRSSRLLQPWVAGIGGGITGLVSVFLVPVVVLVAVFYQLPLLLVVGWYLGSTRRRALRVPSRVEASRVEGSSEADPPVGSVPVEDSPLDDSPTEGHPTESLPIEALPTLPPRLYRRAKRLRRRGTDRTAAGEAAHADGDYEAATTAYAEAVDALADAAALVDGYAVDDTALRADLDRARERYAELSRVHGSATADEYLTGARDISRRGDERYAEGDLDGAVEAWTDAAAVYDRAIAVATDEDAGDLRTLQRELHAKVGETERERRNARRRDAEATAEEALGRGHAALDDGDHEAAKAAFSAARDALETVRAVAQEHDEDVADVDAVIRDARRGVVDATLGLLEAEATALHGADGVDHRERRAVLDRVRRGVDDVEAAEGEVFTDDHRERVAHLEERVAIETLREAVTRQLAEMERAERLYAAEKFFEAREVYRRVHASVDSLAAAEADSLTEEVADELSRVGLACAMNVETIRRAIYEGGPTGELVTTAEVASGGPHREESDLIVDRVLEYIPEYTRVRQLGGGGFADIWVVDGDSGRAALKIPRVSDYETIPESKIRRFVAEAENWQLVAGHPNVVDVIRYGEKPVPWLLLELCDGTLRTRLDADADFDERVEVLTAVGDALGYANAKGIAHLDLKPENVLFDADGVAKLGDWGLSKVMTEGTITGTGHSLLYAAPEQLDRSLGERDIRTDVYQYGVLAYELLTGEHPFEVGSREAVVPPSEVHPDLPDAVDATLLKALAYDQTERYEQVVQVRDALTRALGVEA
jgi:tetratricopeptide (TPR) repeat protein